MRLRALSVVAVVVALLCRRASFGPELGRRRCSRRRNTISARSPAARHGLQVPGQEHLQAGHRAGQRAFELRLHVAHARTQDAQDRRDRLRRRHVQHADVRRRPQRDAHRRRPVERQRHHSQRRGPAPRPWQHPQRRGVSAWCDQVRRRRPRHEVGAAGPRHLRRPVGLEDHRRPRRERRSGSRAHRDRPQSKAACPTTCWCG